MSLIHAALVLSAIIATAAPAAMGACTPASGAMAHISLKELERSYARTGSNSHCQRARIAAEVYYATEPANSLWAVRAQAALESAADWRTLVVQSLRFMQNLDRSDPRREEIRFRTLKAVNALIVLNGRIPEAGDRRWLDWALVTTMNPSPMEQLLAYDRFLSDFPSSSRAKTVRSWKENAVRIFLEKEFEITRRYLRSGRAYAAMSRLEYSWKIESILTSKYLPDVLVEYIRTRFIFIESIESLSLKELRMRFHAPGRKTVERAKVRSEQIHFNCRMIAEWRKSFPRRKLPADVASKSAKYCAK